MRRVGVVVVYGTPPHPKTLFVFSGQGVRMRNKVETLKVSCSKPRAKRLAVPGRRRPRQKAASRGRRLCQPRPALTAHLRAACIRAARHAQRVSPRLMVHSTRSGGHDEVYWEDAVGGGARRRGGNGLSLPRLVLCVAVGIAGLQRAAANTVSDTWDAKRTTRLNTGHENGVIVRGAGSQSQLRIGGAFRFNDCPSSQCSFRCVFVDASGNQMSSLAEGSSDLPTEIACDTAKMWGSSYNAGMVELRVQKAVENGWVTLRITGMVGDQFNVFLEEDIFSVRPTMINAYGVTVTVAGSGFAPDKEYRCVTFEQNPDRWEDTRTGGYFDLVGFPFILVNRTMGTCRITTSYSARATKLSIMSKKTVIDRLDRVNGNPSQGYQLFQPAVSEIRKPSAGGDDIILWKGLNVTWFESWTFTSMLSGLKTGSETMTISGAGFKPTEKYVCEFTLNTAANTGCTGEATLSNVNQTAPATMVSPFTLQCITPAWTGNEPLVKTIFNVRATNVLLPSNDVQVTSFDFVSKPVWSGPTPAEGAVYVEPVDCASLNLVFKASGGMSTLRLTLDYTALRPRPAMDFLQWNATAPSKSQVLFKTDNLRTTYFNDAAAVDEIRSFGYCLGTAQHTLRLPKTQLAETQTEKYVAYNKKSQAFEYKKDNLGILDNVDQPSNLTFTTQTSGDEVTGTLFWNVSRGWEGYGYKICVTARHASINYSVTESENFAKRCIYVVVPKCQKCYGPSEDLSAIASRYGAHWLDLWSVNRNLINTTAVRLASDEVFNTKNDHLYPLVAQRQNIRLGVAYRLRVTDALEAVGKRFGMSLQNLMQLNPDIVAANLV
jgi:hypothetical protein